MSVYQWATYTKQEQAKDELLLFMIFYYFNQSMLWDPLEKVFWNNNFLDALASLELKLWLGESLMFFGFPVNQVKQVMQVIQLIQVLQAMQVMEAREAMQVMQIIKIINDNQW